MEFKYTTTFQYRRYLRRVNDLEKKLTWARKESGEAAQFGDLIENAEFDAALKQEKLLSLILSTLHREMSGCEIVDPFRISTDRVKVGTRIRTRNLDNGEVEVFKIVGIGPSYYEEGEVSYHSPLGRGFMGLKVGDITTINVPAGARRYKILRIERYCPK